MKKINIRIDKMELRNASYLLREEDLPEHPSYHIDLWQPNGYYGRESEYPEDPKDSNFRIYPDNPHCRIHKDCFKSPESCFAIASFDWDKDGYYELHFVGRRPFEYIKSSKDIDTFYKLIEIGDEILNGKINEGYDE